MKFVHTNKKVCRKLMIDRGGIMNVLNGSTKQSNGFVFYYKEKAPPNLLNYKSYVKNRYGVIGVNIETGEIVVFDTIKEAQLKLNIFNISESCNGNRKSAGGFIWEHNRERGVLSSL